MITSFLSGFGDVEGILYTEHNTDNVKYHKNPIILQTSKYSAPSKTEKLPGTKVTASLQREANQVIVTMVTLMVKPIKTSKSLPPHLIFTNPCQSVTELIVSIQTHQQPISLPPFSTVLLWESSMTAPMTTIAFDIDNGDWHLCHPLHWHLTKKSP